MFDCELVTAVSIKATTVYSPLGDDLGPQVERRDLAERHGFKPLGRLDQVVRIHGLDILVLFEFRTGAGGGFFSIELESIGVQFVDATHDLGAESLGELFDGFASARFERHDEFVRQGRGPLGSWSWVPGQGQSAPWRRRWWCGTRRAGPGPFEFGSKAKLRSPRRRGRAWVTPSR